MKKVIENTGGGQLEYAPYKNGISITRYRGIATIVSIPEVIEEKPVIAIEKKAFANCKKLKKIVIGKNIRSIGSKAFYKCKKLKKITIKSKKLVKIGKNAFKGISKKAVIKVPASKKKKYKKLLKKKGLPSKARIIK